MEDCYKQIFNRMPLPCQILKVEGPSFVIVDCNDIYLESTGTKKGDVLNKLIEEAFPENQQHSKDGTELLIQSLKKVLATGKKDEISRYNIPHPNPRKALQQYWTAVNYPLVNRKGEVAYVLHTTQDITAQVQVEKNQKQDQEELNWQQNRHFMEESSDGLYSLDINGKFTSANEGLAQISEMPVEELLQMDFLPFCAPYDEEKILFYFSKAIAGEVTNFEVDFISANGREMVLEISLMPIKINGEIAGAYGIAKDVTNLRNSEKILVEKGKFLEVNASFISSLLENKLENAILEEAFAVVGKTVGVDRMYYFETSHDEKTGEMLISQQVEWCSEKASPQINNPEMQNIPASQVEQMTESLFRGKSFMAKLSKLPEGLLKDIFLGQGIKAMLILPVFFKDNLYGFIGFDDCEKERDWREDEISFLRSLTKNLGIVIEKRAADTALEFQEEQLKRSEQKFKALVQEGSDLMGILDLVGNYKFVSQTTTAILGMKPKEFIGKNAFDFIHPEDKARVQEQYGRLKTVKQVKVSPFRFVDKEGNWRWLETTLTNLTGDPAVEGVVHNTRDITAFRAQALEIDRINERFRLAAIATQDLIYDWNLEKDQVKRFHNSLKGILGYSVEEIGEKEFWRKNIHPEDLGQEQSNLEMTLADKTLDFIKTKYRFKRANGSYANVLDKGCIIRNPEGIAIRLIGAVSDISDLTAKEEDLKMANKRFKRAMKATNEMIWDWDVTKNLMIRSKGFASIFKYTPDESTINSKSWIEKIVPEDRERVEASLKLAMEGKGDKWKEEYRLEKGNGKVAFVTDRGYMVRDKAGKILRMVGATLDVTESRKLMWEIKEQNNILRAIAWEQSHVVRAPLARLKGLLTLLKEEDTEWSREEIVQHISNSADELDEIVKGIIRKTEKNEVEQELRGI